MPLNVNTMLACQITFDHSGLFTHTWAQWVDARIILLWRTICLDGNWQLCFQFIFNYIVSHCNRLGSWAPVLYSFANTHCNPYLASLNRRSARGKLFTLLKGQRTQFNVLSLFFLRVCILHLLFRLRSRLTYIYLKLPSFFVAQISAILTMELPT